jgi:hypothetical protein
MFSYSSGHISGFIFLVDPVYDIRAQIGTWIFAIGELQLPGIFHWPSHLTAHPPQPGNRQNAEEFLYQGVECHGFAQYSTSRCFGEVVMGERERLPHCRVKPCTRGGILQKACSYALHHHLRVRVIVGFEADNRELGIEKGRGPTKGNAFTSNLRR